MAPFGDVAPAQELCRVASRGGGIDDVRPLALEAFGRSVAADVVLWADVDVARGRPGTTLARPGPDGDALARDALARGALARHAVHVAGHQRELTTDDVHLVDEPGAHVVCLALPAPPGHRGGVALRRSTPFTSAETDRLQAVLPIVACAVLAAWRTAPTRAGHDLLTRREADVLFSVASGMSDKQAARALGVSPRTVGKHLEHIYAKLGVGGRTEAAAQAGLFLR